MSKKKPAEFVAFETLAKRLMAVPKSELDKQVDHYNERKKNRKKPRKRPAQRL